MDNGRWITTKTGNRVYITNKATNAYMNNLIRNKTRNNAEHSLTDENINSLISDSINERHENYARDYITRMSPDDFLKLTADEMVMETLNKEKKPLDLKELNKKDRWITLSVDMQTGKVLNHEGRHRMMALKDANYKKVDVVVFPKNYDEYEPKEYRYRKLTGQESMGLQHNAVVVDKLVPVSKANEDRIKRRDY